MPAQPFSAQTRILMCNSCGAPLKASIQGGTFKCEYCGNDNVLTARVERPVLSLAPTEQIDETERTRRLRSQDGTQLVPPDSLNGLFGPGGSIPEWKMQEALAAWQSARHEVATTSSFEASERLLFLTLALANKFADGDNDLRVRAMFESALEVFQLPRHMQMMRAFLARNAAKTGDLEAAEQWLAPCDQRSDDLDTDSAYRFSRAYIDMFKGEWEGVHGAVGATRSEVPIAQMVEAFAVLLRAHAWEQRGDAAQASAQLKEYMASAGTGSRRALDHVRTKHTALLLCPHSYAQTTQAHRQSASASAGARASGGVGGVLLGTGILMLLIGLGTGVAAVVFTVLTFAVDDSFAGGIVGAGITCVTTGSAGLMITIGGFRMRRSAKKAAQVRLNGTPGFATVQALTPTGMRVNDVPQYVLQLRVQLEGAEPYVATIKMMLNPVDVAQLQGAQVPVLVDPDNPQNVIVETS